MRKSKQKGKVHIIDRAFYMPQLKRWRRIWLYLPAGYGSSDLRYPVLYMHDGQNLFEDWSAFGEEWQVDETLDRVDGKCIVVGIDNGDQKRITEYNVLDHKDHGKGEGSRYLQFITGTLKPYIDYTYRTLPGREHCWMAGSSMGGLISFFAALQYPHIFGRLGIFSPSLWLLPDLAVTMEKYLLPGGPMPKLFFYAGEKEGAMMADDVKKAVSLWKDFGAQQVKLILNPEGEHLEAAWRQHFPQCYAFLRRTATSAHVY